MGSDAKLTANLDIALPGSVPTGTVTALFCCGSCSHATREVTGVELRVGGRAERPAAQRMARPDLGAGARTGFWATVPIEAGGSQGELAVELRAELDGGGAETARLSSVEVVPRTPSSTSPGDASLAVCLATFDPDADLLHGQLESLQEQTDRDWVCLISDDCSQPERYAAIEAVIAEDERFVLSRSERHLGFYRNFERALHMVPAGIELVALCDQDDRWHPEKLETLRRSIGDAELVYSDARLVDPSGDVISDTMWVGRRNNHRDLASMLTTNTITGAASLFRRRVLDRALPFPEAPGWQFHDHWLGTVALTLGDIGYVDRPLYDYTQHSGAVLRGLVAGDAEAAVRAARAHRAPRRQRAREALERWRARYFYGYLPIQLRALVLLQRCADRLGHKKRRALSRLVAAERSPLAFGWLAARRLRLLFGRTETHGAETLLVTGILWRRLAAIWSRSPRAASRTALGTGMPTFEPKALETRRWRRRRA